MMHTMAVGLSISNINLSVSELDHEFHLHRFLGKNTSSVCELLVCYALNIRNKCYYVLPFTSQSKDGCLLGCVTIFPSGTPYPQYKGLFAGGHRINHDQAILGPLKIVPHACLIVQIYKLNYPKCKLKYYW